MSTWRFLLRSLVYHWPMLSSVAAGVAVATGVLTGALVVGDSVNESLRRVTLDRLGSIHSLLMADHFFTQELSERMAADARFREVFQAAEPVIWIDRVTLEVSGDAPRRTRGVQLLGTQSTFWDRQGPDDPRPQQLPFGRQIILNQPLADDLQVRVGDRVLVRLPRINAVSSDSVLGDKSDVTQSMADMEIISIVPAEGLGRFAISASQQLPLTAYVGLDTLQSTLERPAEINAVLVVGDPKATEASAPPDEAVSTTLEDLGLRLAEIRQTYQPERADTPLVAFQYFHLTSEGMVFSPGAESVLNDVLKRLDADPVITYLANRLERVASEPGAGTDGAVSRQFVPYSTVCGVVESGPLSPLAATEPDSTGDSAEPISPSESLGADEIALNRWTADQLGAQVGQTIRLHYYRPETADGLAVETHADFVLRQIVPITQPIRPYDRRQAAEFRDRPTMANDPELTPSVAGVTDQQSIDQWDPPFPFDNRLITSADEDYWDYYRTTPKAFVSLSAARPLWQSRFGVVTSYRIPAAESRMLSTVREELETAVQGRHGPFGFQWLGLRSDGLRAARGTTPFNGLFLGFSCFLIASALLLVLLLFRLGIEQRARELGLLLSVGVSGARASGFWLREGAVVSAVGAVVGTGLAVGYAALMIWALRTIWVGAVTTPFLQLTVHGPTLAIGATLGAAVGLATIGISCWRAARRPARELLSGRTEAVVMARPKLSIWFRWLIPLLLVAAVLAGVFALRLSGEAQAGAFFAGGVSVLVALVMGWRAWLYQKAWRDRRPAIANLWALAQLNLSRNLTRSLLTVGLLAAASFLIVAISAFRLPPTERGTGRFNLVAESDRPIFENLDLPAGREAWFGRDAAKLASMHVVSFRVLEGDDASCRNLFRAQRPRIFGLPASAADWMAAAQPQRFHWSAQMQVAGGPVSPWEQLDEDENGHSADPSQRVIPVVLDKNTALYSLGLMGGAGQEFEKDYGEGRRLRFRVVGLLDNSLLQGVLIVSERNLLRHFPEVAGYRYFLIDTGGADPREASTMMERMLGDRGFDARDGREVLAGLYQIQNTYLTTFQSLGGLGLLLGTLGLSVVQVRNVLERRREMGLLQALGFARSRLVRLVLAEHFLLLLSGLAAGCLAALWVVLPHWWAGGAAIPWRGLVGTLLLVLVIGIVSGLIAVRRALQIGLLDALRQE